MRLIHRDKLSSFCKKKEIKFKRDRQTKIDGETERCKERYRERQREQTDRKGRKDRERGKGNKSKRGKEIKERER